MRRRVLAMAMALTVTFTSLPVNSLTAAAASDFTDGQESGAQTDSGTGAEELFSSEFGGEPVDFAGADLEGGGRGSCSRTDPGSGSIPGGEGR
ncbi:MAG: hypothetical protein Q4D55_06905 [Eubacteriales bacterium]|nr:hypothetical protein [Eubacteriales bacterium]